MTQIEQSVESDTLVNRYEYDDHTVIAIDFGSDAEPTVDVVDDTAIVVLADDSQREIDLPDGTVEVFNRNGILSFEVRE